MNKYNIWIEGYKDDKGVHKAKLLAINIKGNTFDEALRNWLSNPMSRKWSSHFRENNGKYYIWCREIFSDEKMARKSFG